MASWSKCQARAGLPAWPAVMAVRRYFPARRLAAIAWTRAATALFGGVEPGPGGAYQLVQFPGGLGQLQRPGLGLAGGVRRGVHQDPAQVHHRVALAGPAQCPSRRPRPPGRCPARRRACPRPARRRSPPRCPPRAAARRTARPAPARRPAARRSRPARAAIAAAFA